MPVEFVRSKNLIITFSEIPDIKVRYATPYNSKEEIKDIKKYPFVLLNDVDVNIDYINKHDEVESYQFTIAAGYKYDGASIPAFFNRLIGASTDNEFLIAALIHDVLCEHHDYINNNRKLSTLVFNSLLEVSKVPAWRRYLMKHSVDIYQKGFCKWQSTNVATSASKNLSVK